MAVAGAEASWRKFPVLPVVRGFVEHAILCFQPVGIWVGGMKKALEAICADQGHPIVEHGGIAPYDTVVLRPAEIFLGKERVEIGVVKLGGREVFAPHEAQLAGAVLCRDARRLSKPLLVFRQCADCPICARPRNSRRVLPASGD